jgi:hypothetical protein
MTSSLAAISDFNAEFSACRLLTCALRDYTWLLSTYTHPVRRLTTTANTAVSAIKTLPLTTFTEINTH